MRLTVVLALDLADLCLPDAERVRHLGLRETGCSAQRGLHVLELERLGVVLETAAGLLAVVDVEHLCVDRPVLALTGPQAGDERGYTKNLDGNRDVASAIEKFCSCDLLFCCGAAGNRTRFGLLVSEPSRH
jgi:hypothetical protein